MLQFVFLELSHICVRLLFKSGCTSNKIFEIEVNIKFKRELACLSQSLHPTKTYYLPLSFAAFSIFFYNCVKEYSFFSHFYNYE